jgi:membrane-associated phospholipid phosphatase
MKRWMQSMHDLDMQALLATYGGAHGAWSRTMLAFTLVGSGWSALLVVPFLFRGGRTQAFAQALALGIVAQAIWTWTVKLAVGRVRPWIALGYPAPYGAPHDGSFPSGHASGSFCVAAFLVVALPAAWPAPANAPASAWRARLVGAGAVAIAVLIGLSRVYLGAHFPSDVIAGAVMGACFGAAAASLYLARRRAAG